MSSGHVTVDDKLPLTQQPNEVVSSDSDRKATAGIVDTAPRIQLVASFQSNLCRDSNRLRTLRQILGIAGDHHCALVVVNQVNPAGCSAIRLASSQRFLLSRTFSRHVRRRAEGCIRAIGRDSSPACGPLGARRWRRCSSIWSWSATQYARPVLRIEPRGAGPSFRSSHANRS